MKIGFSNEGWRCPVCGLGNAPWNPYCHHCAKRAKDVEAPLAGTEAGGSDSASVSVKHRENPGHESLSPPAASTDPNCTCIIGNDMQATTGILECPVHDPDDYSVMPS